MCRVEKEARLGQHGCVLWFTGLSGSGKSTVAATLEHALAKVHACDFFLRVHAVSTSPDRGTSAPLYVVLLKSYSS